MKKEWFEPGPDGESPFEREYYNHRESGTIAGNAISAAFRALLAQDAAQEHDTPALQVGDVVRLERYEETPELGWLEEEAYLVGKLATIDFFDDDGHPYLKIQDHHSLFWHPDALTLVRRAGEPVPVDKDAKDAEIAELRAEVERWKSRADAHEQNYKAMLRRVDEVVAERDALQARIEAGERAWEKWKQRCGSLWLWAFPGATTSQAWSDVCDALDADYVVYPIADADERKGERRKVIPARIRRDGFDYSMDYDTPWMTNRRKYDRRRTAGTIADRGKAS